MMLIGCIKRFNLCTQQRLWSNIPQGVDRMLWERHLVVNVCPLYQGSSTFFKCRDAAETPYSVYILYKILFKSNYMCTVTKLSRKYTGSYTDAFYGNIFEIQWVESNKSIKMPKFVSLTKSVTDPQQYLHGPLRGRGPHVETTDLHWHFFFF